MVTHLNHTVLFGLLYTLVLWGCSTSPTAMPMLHLIWPPLALLTAAFILAPMHHWPLYAGASMLAEFIVFEAGIIPAGSRLFGLITVVESAALVWLCQRLSGTGLKDFSGLRLKPLLIYFGLSVVVIPPLATLLTALIDTAWFDTSSNPAAHWVHASLSDSTALVILTPWLLCLAPAWQRLRERDAQDLRAPYEIATILALLAIVWGLIFLQPLGDTFSSPVLLVVPLALAAMRMPSSMSVVLAASTALAGLLATLYGLGPFEAPGTFQGASQAQQFFSCMVVTAVLIACTVAPAQSDRQRLEFFENAVRFSREGIVITDADNDQPILYCNPAFERISGYRLDNIKGSNCRFMNRAHRDQEGLARIRQALNAQQEVDVVVQNQRKNGESFWCSLSIAPVFNRKGAAKYYIGIQSDVTEKIEAQQRMETEIARQTADLQTVQQRVLMASEVSGLGIWDWDTQTDELIWDDNMHRIYETPEDRKRKLLYEFWEQSVHPLDVQRAAGSLQKCVEEGKTWNTEFRLLLPDGRIKYIRASAQMKLDEAGNTIRVLGGNLDITDTRTLEASLRAAAEKAKRADQLKSEFLANMSHEIRTPLNGVLGMVDLLKNTGVSQIQRDYIGMIQTSASALLNVLNDILDISKIEAGQLEIHLEPVHLEECLGLTVKSQAQAAFAKGLELHYYVDPALHLWVMLDAQRFAQIINNLLSNAIKFTSKGDIRVIATATPCAEDTEIQQVTIEVEDSGIGIATDQMSSIFNPFQQADGSVSRRYGGTGLGLAISKRLINMLGGHIEAESREGVGTKFRITLPLRKTAPRQRLPQDQVLSNNDIKKALERCLIVDDNEINRRWLGDMVSNWGGKPLLAASGEEALQYLREAANTQRPIEVMLLDKNMPESSGFDLMNSLKKAGLAAPRVILMLSSSDVDADVKLAKIAGIDQYLLKPVLQSEVYDALITLLDKAHLASSAEIQQQPHGDSGLHFLVAEDNPVNQRLVVDALTARGHQVDAVGDGQAALRQRTRQNYDAIFMDVQMPVLNGLEATREIRRLEAESALDRIPIVGITANAMKGDRERCIESGMDHYLTKPVNLDTLYRLIDEQLLGEAPPIPSGTPSPVPEAAVPNMKRSTSRYFDESVGLKICGGNRGLLIKVIQKAREACPGMHTELANAIDSGDIPTAARQAHKLKGAVANFCSPSLAQALKDLELEAANMTEAELRDRWQTLDAMLNTLINELNYYLEAQTT